MSDELTASAERFLDALRTSDWPAAGIALEAVRRSTDRLADELVREMRAVGRTWADVAEVVGTTRQAAHERYRHLDP